MLENDTVAQISSLFTKAKDVASDVYQKLSSASFETAASMTRRMSSFLGDEEDQESQQPIFTLEAPIFDVVAADVTAVLVETRSRQQARSVSHEDLRSDVQRWEWEGGKPLISSAQKRSKEI
eukprot:Trichotokara_eunicae@DN5940_c0_g1_i1.p1